MEEISPLPDNVLELGRALIGSPIFLVGCARSGTSILGEAIAAHPRVAYLFEASTVWNARVPQKTDQRLTGEDATPGIAEETYRKLSALRSSLDGDVLLEKNPKHVIRISFLRALFPEARFVHIIRDGRDATASLMFRNRGAQWGHLKLPGWEGLLKRYPDENHIRCAHQWRYAVATARSDAKQLGKNDYLEVRYETLVSDAHGTIEKVLAFLQLNLEPQVISFLDKIQDKTGGSYHARRQIRHYIENHERRVGRFRENLSPSQIADVHRVCGDLLAELGYLDE